MIPQLDDGPPLTEVACHRGLDQLVNLILQFLVQGTKFF